MKRKKRTGKAALKKKCDALWSEITKLVWRARFGSLCPWCKKRTIQHSDHIANRWKHNTRWMVVNCVCLCMPCHIYRKKREPAEWTKMVEATIGKALYEELLEQSRGYFRVTIQNLEKVLDYLLFIKKSSGDRTGCR